MQRHRAGRLAVLLSLSRIDAKPDGVARTACIAPGTSAQNESTSQRTLSTVGLMAPSASENSMEESENEGSSRNLVSGKSQSSAARPIQEDSQRDSSLQMSIDITQTASVLRLEGISEECSSTSEDSGIQMRETNGCTEPHCVAPSGADHHLNPPSSGQTITQTSSAAQLLRDSSHASNDFLGKYTSCVHVLFAWPVVCGFSY